MYSCFIEPKTGRIYKIHANNVEYINIKKGNDNFNADDRDWNTGNLSKIIGSTIVGGNSDAEPLLCNKVEVLLVRLSDSMYSEMLKNKVQQGHYILSTEQMDSLVEYECITLDLDLILKEITYFSGKPCTLVYAYSDISLKKNIKILEKLKCHYAVSPEMNSSRELLGYIKTLLSIWKNPSIKPRLEYSVPV